MAATAGAFSLVKREFALYGLRAFHKKRNRRKTRKHFQRRNGFRDRAAPEGAPGIRVRHRREAAPGW